MKQIKLTNHETVFGIRGANTLIQEEVPDPTTLLFLRSFEFAFHTEWETGWAQGVESMWARGRGTEWLCVREAQKTVGAIGADSERGGWNAKTRGLRNNKDKSWDSTRGVKTPGCVITWVVHVVHLALARKLLVSSAPFCCGETWLALVNCLQHTPLSAQVSLQALRFLSPRATPQPLRGETATTGNSLPSSASSLIHHSNCGAIIQTAHSLCRAATLPAPCFSLV